MELLSIGKFAKAVGVSTMTLRRLHTAGELVPEYVTKNGTRYYSTEQLKYFYKSMSDENTKIVIGYCRVSTASQKDDLDTQVANVRQYMLAKGYQFEIITDIGSGINYKNKGLQKLLCKVCKQEVSKVVVLYKDRLVRFGFDLIQYVCELHGVSIEVIDGTEQTREQELTDDLIQIITVFANRLYGARSKKTRLLIEGVKNNVNSNKDTIGTNS